MPDSLTDGGERLIRLETKFDEFIREFRTFAEIQRTQCKDHHLNNADEHARIWIAIEDVQQWKWKLAGAVGVLFVILPITTAVVSSLILRAMGL